MSDLQIGIQFIARPGDSLDVDSVSLVSDGAEKVVNGGFDEFTPFTLCPFGWTGRAAGITGLEGIAAARTETGIYQIVTVDNGVEFSFDVSLRGIGAVYVSATTRVLSNTTTKYLTKDGWGTAVEPLYYVELKDWEAFPYPHITPPVGTPQTLAGILEQGTEEPVVVVPTVESATLAIAGLAVAGLSRAGFYPKQTDDIVAPPADPPVFDGGIYAYHKDEEGKE